MDSNAFKYGLGGLIIGGLTVWLYSNSFFNLSGRGMMGTSTQNYTQGKNTTMSSNIDRHFIEQMIPHHIDAITMAKLAPTRTQRPEIIELSKSIIVSQVKEIDQMKEWYKNWYGREVPTGILSNSSGMMGGGMHMGMMGNDTDIKRLELTDDFDKAFIEEMIPHHQMAVMMGQMLKNSTSREEMKKLADDIITAQTREINEMRQWYTDWGYTQ